MLCYNAMLNVMLQCYVTMLCYNAMLNAMLQCYVKCYVTMLCYNAMSQCYVTMLCYNAMLNEPKKMVRRQQTCHEIMKMQGCSQSPNVADSIYDDVTTRHGVVNLNS